MKYIIRKSVPADLETIIDLCAEHAEYEKIKFSKEGKRDKLFSLLFNENPKLFCLIVENEKEILGYATYSFDVSTWDAAYFTNIDCLFLRPHARGFGAGEEVMKIIARQSVKNNSRLMQWVTPPFNERAIKFYYRIGATSREKTKLYLNEEKIDELIK